MEEESENSFDPPQMPQMGIPVPVQSMLMSAMGEFLFVLGLLFGLVGAAAFITEYFRLLNGSGEMIIGLILAVAGFLLLRRSKIVVSAMPRPPTQMPPQQSPKKEEPPSGYR